MRVFKFDSLHTKKEALVRELLFYFVDKSTEKKMRKEKYKKKAN